MANIESPVSQLKINELKRTQFKDATELSETELYAVDPEFTGGKLLKTDSDGDIVESTLSEDNVGTVKSVNNVQPVNGNVTISIPTQVTESTVSGWGFTKNTGTVTSVNNISPTNGNVSISIPDSTGDLTNDSGFITLSSLSGASPISYNSNTGAISVATGYKITTTAQVTQIGTNTTDIATINSKIPNDASSSNQLADKRFVNSSISTNTANFIGTFNSVAELDAYSGTLTNNDYAFVISQDTFGNTVYNRYKWNGTEWLFEYALNNSSFTADQWASINSTATASKISQIATNASDISALQSGKQDNITGAATTITSSDLTASCALVSNSSGKVGVSSVTATELGYLSGVTSAIQTQLNGKQATISDLATIRSGASAGATAVQPSALNSYVPTSRTINGKALSSNISLTATDVNALPNNTVIPTDISGNTINGAPLSNTSSHFFGTSTSAATDVEKVVSIPSITSLSAGQFIIVLPTTTSTVANSTLKLNNFTAYPMRYQNAAITTSTDTYVWTANTPSVFVFDGNYWRFVCQGYRQVYSAMSVAEGTTGTATTIRAMRADSLKQIIQKTTLTGIDTSTSGTVVATDTITEGIGKLQAQIGSIETALHTINSGS